MLVVLGEPQCDPQMCLRATFVKKVNCGFQVRTDGGEGEQGERVDGGGFGDSAEHFKHCERGGSPPSLTRVGACEAMQRDFTFGAHVGEAETHKPRTRYLRIRF